MVRNHLRVVFGTAERFDPLGGFEMLPCPLCARDLPVCDVPDERMLERELRFSFD